MYINGKYDCIIFLFLTGIIPPRDAQIMILKPGTILLTVPPAQPPPNPYV